MKFQNLIHILIGIVCIGFLPRAQAISPAPDGGYPGGNTAEGQNAIFSLTTGGYNTALGFFSLTSNTVGAFNTATGAGTLLANTSDQNTATGAGALLSNTTGPSNTANGAFALFSNTTGSYNTAIGESALSQNTAGSSNIALGFGAGGGVTTASDVICIRATGENVSNSCYIEHIFAQQVGPMGAAVVVDTHGKLGTVVSSRRFKHDIKPMAKSSEGVLALKPVTFHYKSDNTGTPQFGLIAEDVAEINPDLVVRDKDGEIYTVRYEAVNAMMLNEFLKEHKKVEEQQATIADLKSAVARQRRDFEGAIAQEKERSEATAAQQQKEIHVLIGSLNEQAAQIEKVSDQLAAASPSRHGLNVSKTVRQIVLNNQ